METQEPPARAASLEVGDDANVESEEMKSTPPNRSWRFWCIFISLCLVSFISALDATIVTTSLPVIIREVGGEEDYVWIANSFVLASTAPQPLFAQLSNIFGRRWPMLIALSLFILGSGISGGATNSAMLIGGRTIQGLGSGGFYVLLDIILCDLIPLRDRGKYLGFQLSTAGIGTTIGPLVGGSLAEANWRWIFYMDLPITGVALLATVLFLNVRYVRSPTWKKSLLRVDFLGNAIFIPSIVAVLIGLVTGGVQYPWSSWRVILPLVLGVVGWVIFHIHQASPICKEPSVPPHLFKNRTSATGFALAFISSVLLQSVAYFMPIYFQSALGTSPLKAGVNFLPYTVAIIPFAIIAGAVMSKLGHFKPLHWAGFALNTIGSGLLSTLDETSSTAEWAIFLIITAAGTGFILTAMLPSILAALPESDVATGTGTYSFVRSFGYVWGVTMPSIIFNNQFERYSDRIGDPVVRSQLSTGAAYAFASGGFLGDLPTKTHDQVVSVYVDALQAVWQATIAFSALGFLLVFIEKHVEMRKELDTEFGLEEKQKTEGSEDDRGNSAMDDGSVIGLTAQGRSKKVQD